MMHNSNLHNFDSIILSTTNSNAERKETISRGRGKFPGRRWPSSTSRCSSSDEFFDEDGFENYFDMVDDDEVIVTSSDYEGVADEYIEGVLESILKTFSSNSFSRPIIRHSPESVQMEFKRSIVSILMSLFLCNESEINSASILLFPIIFF